MKLEYLNDQEFDEFVYKSSKAHFMQTSAWAKVNSKRGYLSHKLGLKNDDGTLIGTALLLEKKILYFSSFYCPRGFITDYTNKEYVALMVKELKNFVRKHKGLYFKMDPDLIIHKLDPDGNIIETDEANLEMIDYLTSLGGKHRGFTTKFNESSLPRYTFRVDITGEKENIINRFHNTTKKILGRNNPYNLKFRKGDISDVTKFYETMKDTAARKKMYLEKESFFTSFYNTLNECGMSDIFVTSANIKELKKIFIEKKEELLKQKENIESKPDGKKKDNLLKDFNDLYQKNERCLNEVMNIEEDEVVLSSIITAKFKDKVWLIHGGNSNKLMFLNGNYEAYFNILLDSKKDGYDIVDFYGTEGKIDKNSSIYGIYLFKVRFGGDFDEFIGEFDFVVHPLINSVIQKLLHIRRTYLIKKSIKENS